MLFEYGYLKSPANCKQTLNKRQANSKSIEEKFGFDVRTSSYFQSISYRTFVFLKRNTFSGKHVTGVMHRICGLRLSPNFGVWSAADNNFYLGLKRAFAVFTDKYLQPCVCSGHNFTAVVHYKNPRTEIKSEVIEKQLTMFTLYRIDLCSPFFYVG